MNTKTTGGNDVGIYEEMKQAGVEISNHESDLYVPKNKITTPIINNYKFKKNVTIFVNQIDHKLWYDIPFAYQPYWDKVSEAKR